MAPVIDSVFAELTLALYSFELGSHFEFVAYLVSIEGINEDKHFDRDRLARAVQMNTHLIRYI